MLEDWERKKFFFLNLHREKKIFVKMKIFTSKERLILIEGSVVSNCATGNDLTSEIVEKLE